MRVAFVGLGVMGAPMAGHLAAAGHQVTVYNRSEAKATQWVAQHTGEYKTTPRDAAETAEMVMLCVGNDDDVRSVVYGGEGVLASMAEGAILVDHTTASATLARELAAACAKQGVHFLDSPVSGGQAGAEAGALTIMIGGEAESLAQARPVLASYGKTIEHIGEHGAGQLAKMANQICIAGVVQGLAEALHFADQAGLDIDRLLSAIGGGAAQSWQMDHRAKTMARGEYEFGFAVDWMRKDLGIVLQEARSNQAQLPVTALVDQFYAQVQTMGGGRWDTSSLLARLQAFRTGE